MPADIDHAVLGKLKWNGELNSWESVVELRVDCPVDLRLLQKVDAGPTSNMDELLRSGIDMLEWARQSEPACRDQIAKELFELYNDTWAPEDTLVPTTQAEFLERITPWSLVLDIDGSGYFYWDDDDMFAGHWIEIRFHKDHTIFEVGLAG